MTTLTKTYRLKVGDKKTDVINGNKVRIQLEYCTPGGSCVKCAYGPKQCEWFINSFGRSFCCLSKEVFEASTYWKVITKTGPNGGDVDET